MVYANTVGSLPFLLPVDASLGIAMKHYLDELAAHAEPTSAAAKATVKEEKGPREWFPHAQDFRGDLERAFSLWDAVGGEMACSVCVWTDKMPGVCGIHQGGRAGAGAWKGGMGCSRCVGTSAKMRWGKCSRGPPDLGWRNPGCGDVDLRVGRRRQSLQTEALPSLKMRRSILFLVRHHIYSSESQAGHPRDASLHPPPHRLHSMRSRKGRGSTACAPYQIP